MSVSTLNWPKLQINIEGKGITRDLYNIETFNPKVSEWTDELLAQDGWVQVFNNRMSSCPVRKVVIESPYFNPNVELPWVTQVRITMNDPVSGLIQSVKNVEGVCIENYPQSFGETIEEIEVQVSSIQLSKIVSVRTYSWNDIIGA